MGERTKDSHATPKGSDCEARKWVFHSPQVGVPQGGLQGALVVSALRAPILTFLGTSLGPKELKKSKTIPKLIFELQCLYGGAGVSGPQNMNTMAKSGVFAVQTTGGVRVKK